MRVSGSCGNCNGNATRRCLVVKVIRLSDDTGNTRLVLRQPEDQVESLYLCQETAATIWPILRKFAETGNIE